MAWEICHNVSQSYWVRLVKSERSMHLSQSELSLKSKIERQWMDVLCYKIIHVGIRLLMLFKQNCTYSICLHPFSFIITNSPWLYFSLVSSIPSLMLMAFGMLYGAPLGSKHFDSCTTLRATVHQIFLLI